MAPNELSSLQNSRTPTIRHPNWPNLVWVEIEDEDGNVGLGETFSLAEAVVGYIHRGASPRT